MNMPLTAVLAPPDRLYTPEDLFTLPDAGDHRYELEDGQLVEKEMSMLASWVAGRCLTVLNNYCLEHHHGWILSSDNTYQCFPANPTRIRRPDVSFIAAGRVSQRQFRGGHIRLAPDLIAEVDSPNDGYYEVFRRLRDYLQAGVRLAWVVNPDDQSVTIYRPDQLITWLQADQELTGADVLPGFRCVVRDLFPPPELLATLTETNQ